MADVSVKMGVSGISQFKQGMQQAQQSVKTMDAALKKNEAQLKASGNAEQYMATKSDLLKQKLDAQKKEVDQANKALQVLVRSGVDPASKEYQKMAQSLLNAETAMIDTQTQIRNLGNETANTAEKASKLETSLGGLNRKVSLQQVNSAVKSISGGLEQATKKAIELGKQLWDNIIDTASYSDDVATAATRMGMSTEEYQRLKGVLDSVGDMTVEEWKKAKRKVQSAIYNQTDEQADVLALLGVNTHQMIGTGGHELVRGAARDAEDVLWDIGKAIQQDVASGKISYDQAETWSNLFFGKGYDSLNGVFSMGREAFNEALEVQKTATEEALKNNAALNDKVIQLENTFQALKVELLGGISPALTKVADAINGVLGSLMDYLQTPEGQQKLEALGDSISKIFGNIEDFDPAAAVDSFASVIDGVVTSIQWIADNWQSVVTGIKAIVIAWGAVKGAEGITTFMNLIDGIKGLGSGGAAAGAAAGSGWGSSFASAASAAISAVPWLAVALAAAVPMVKKVEEAGGIEQLASEIPGDAENALDVAKAWLGDTDAKLRVFNRRNKEVNDFMKESGIDKILNQSTGEKSTGEKYPDDPNSLYKSQIKKLDENLKILEENGIEIPAELTLQDKYKEAQRLVEELGTIQVPVELVPTSKMGATYWWGKRPVGGGGGAYYVEDAEQREGFANGIWSVPFDGYRAVLHKGERVVPAREVGSSRNFSSNLYVESMYMNNGQDAQGMAAAMAAAQRRTMSGYGS